jgi:membrane protein
VCRRPAFGTTPAETTRYIRAEEREHGMRLDELCKLLRSTIKKARQDNLASQAAALSYYTVFSLPALLVIVLSIAGWVFGSEAASGRIEREMRSLVGESGAASIQSLVEYASSPGSHSGRATMWGLLTLLFGATAVFAQLQSSLNAMWEVEASPGRRGFWGYIRKRLISFGMVMSFGFLMLVSLTVSAALSALGDYLRLHFVEGAYVFILQALNFVASFATITVLLAAIYVFLPDARLPWRNAWFGAAVTALLFMIGKMLIGFYLGRGSPGTAYGAAGSLAILLVWIYYSSITLFIGAEFTQTYLRWRGVRVHPEKHAVRLEKHRPEVREVGREAKKGGA